MSDDLTALYTGIRSKLLASAGVTAQVGQRVYRKRAPEAETGTPYMVFYISAGGYENITPGDLLNVLVTVEAWAHQDQQAVDAFEAAYTALHKQELTISGWHNFWCMSERLLDLPPDTFKGKQYFRSGAEFRIRASRV